MLTDGKEGEASDPDKVMIISGGSDNDS